MLTDANVQTYVYDDVKQLIQKNFLASDMWICVCILLKIYQSC